MYEWTRLSTATISPIWSFFSYMTLLCKITLLTQLVALLDLPSLFSRSPPSIRLSLTINSPWLQSLLISHPPVYQGSCTPIISPTTFIATPPPPSSLIPIPRYPTPRRNYISLVRMHCLFLRSECYLLLLCSLGSALSHSIMLYPKASPKLLF